MLFAQKGPVLSVETVGPRRIAVGKESSYVIAIKNAGEVADDVVVFVDLPAWADVMGTEVSTGTAQPPTPGTDREPLRWQIGHLQANSQERLVLRIVPRESRPFDLAVRWDYKPVASQAMIEVQEPKLVLNLEGPRDILYGEKEVYKLRLSNVGTGAAEDVLITLQPVGAGDNQPVSHNLGIIGAGQQRSIEVELTARQVGDLMIQVEVRGGAGVHAELVETVLVRRASLQVDLQGPDVQYVGTVATYRMDVANPGTAPARNVKLSVSLPPGAKYLSGVDGARLEANGTKLGWVLGSLEPAGRKSYFVKCNLSLPGAARMSVLCGADGELTASSNTTTRVEAMADLVLDVKDPSGPIPVGEETSYELRIRNRGTKNAEGVEVVAYFSRGIEPIVAEGGQHRIAAGQVVFSPIPSVAAGEDHVLVIRARAETAGNHIFRAEVHCKPLGVRLVSEESTHFYQSKSQVRQATDPDVPEVSSSAPGRSIREVDRRASAVPVPYGPGQHVPARYGQPTVAPRQ